MNTIIAYHDIDSVQFTLIRKELTPNIILKSGIKENLDKLDNDVRAFLFLLTESTEIGSHLLDYAHKIRQLSEERGKFMFIVSIGSVRIPPVLNSASVNVMKKNASEKEIAYQIVSAFNKQSILNNEKKAAKSEETKVETTVTEETLHLYHLLQQKIEQSNNSQLEKLDKKLFERVRLYFNEPQSNQALSNHQLIIQIEQLMGQIDQKNIPTAYYLLKVNPDTWPIPQLTLGYQARFHTHDLQNVKRKEYKLFEQLRVGDRILGFAFHHYMSVICIFEVTETISNDNKLGEGVGIEIINTLNPHIPLANFRSAIDFSESLYNDNPQRLFELSPSLFNTILDSTSTIKRKTQDRDIITNYINDSNLANTSDQLDFQYDVDSFATLITLEKAPPPLAIGLFGAWGSGKSFFMEKLSKRISDYTQKEGTTFIKHVVQVKFNAWHYSDGNLWASLITHIFDELNNYATNKKFNQESVKAIYQQMDLTSIEISQTAKKVEEADDEIKTLQFEQSKLKDTIDQKKASLEMLKIKDIWGVIFNQPSVQGSLRIISKTDTAQQAIENIDDLKERYGELNSTWKQFHEALSMFRSKKGNWWKVWVMAAAIPVIILTVLLTPLLGTVLKYISIASSSLISITIFIKSFDWLKPHFKTARKIFNRMKSLKEAVEDRAEQYKYFEQDEIDKLTAEIRVIKEEKEHFDKILQEKQDIHEKLKYQIEQIGSGKLISTFISGKSGEDGYGHELGIISRIRKDFSQLNHLFLQQKAVHHDKDNEKERFQIDRIILYVDDLDRCNAEIVVKTLEAIHLLLAFELFVVVVGVDPRWLNNALDEKYANLFYEKDDDKPNLEKAKITSFDYLEKIFQIPFALKPITPMSKNKLIAYLTEKDLKITENPQSIEESIQDQPEQSQQQLKEEYKPTEKLQTDDELNIQIEEYISFSSDEVLQMQRLSYLIEDSPRTIKRYINIYRLIKAHKSYSIETIPSKTDYTASMLLLGIIIGSAEHANTFLKKLMSSSDKSVKDFILEMEDSPVKQKLQNLPNDIQQMLNTSTLKENAPLISRFSFRTYQLNEKLG